MKELTKAEEQVMRVLWELEQAFVKEIIEHLPEPKPAYSTVATIIKILEEKGFVAHKAYGRTHQYFPLVEKEVYAKEFMQNFVGKYFSSSYKQLVSFFVKTNDLSLQEMEEIRSLVEEDSSEETQA